MTAVEPLIVIKKASLDYYFLYLIIKRYMMMNFNNRKFLIYKALTLFFALCFLYTPASAAPGIPDPIPQPPPSGPPPFVELDPTEYMVGIINKISTVDSAYAAKLNNLLGKFSPPVLFAYFYNVLFPIGIAIGIFAILGAGYAFLTSEGRPDKVKDASEKLTSAIIGIVFIALSIVILRLIFKAVIDPSANF